MSEGRPDQTSLGNHRAERDHAWRKPQRTALCCVCGATRPTSAHGATGEPQRVLEGQRDGDRCLVTRKCQTCRQRTPHAYLRVGDYADWLEYDGQPYPNIDDTTEGELLELETDEARAQGITVLNDTISEPVLAVVSQRLDHGPWVVILNTVAASKERRQALRRALHAIGDESGRAWFVQRADPEHDQPPNRYAVFVRTD